MLQAFKDYYTSKDVNERKQFLSSFLNDDKNCVLYEELRAWVDDMLDSVIPDVSDIFRIATIRTIDYVELREDIFNYLEQSDELDESEDDIQCDCCHNIFPEEDTTIVNGWDWCPDCVKNPRRAKQEFFENL